MYKNLPEWHLGKGIENEGLIVPQQTPCRLPGGAAPRPMPEGAVPAPPKEGLAFPSLHPGRTARPPLKQPLPPRPELVFVLDEVALEGRDRRALSEVRLRLSVSLHSRRPDEREHPVGDVAVGAHEYHPGAEPVPHLSEEPASVHACLDVHYHQGGDRKN